MDALDELIEHMKMFDFSQYETRAYCALLQKSPMNGHEVSRVAAIPPSKIYETLQRLHLKGAVLIYRSDPTLYSPVPYEDLISRLRQQTNASFLIIEQQLGNLKKPGETDLTWSLTGVANIVDTMIHIIERCEKCIFAALWDQEMPSLEKALKAAFHRGVELQIAVYGTFDLGVPSTYDLTLCGQSAQERLGNRRLSVLVGDREETTVAELIGNNRDQGIWTQNTVLSLLATEYVKEEIMGRCLINELGEERYQMLRREKPALLSMLRSEAKLDGSSIEEHQNL
jgi:HTH-type transcriptional regulator, sugar sensing transcriptional regulator